jgi:effector-binding domain-containing protein
MFKIPFTITKSIVINKDSEFLIDLLGNFNNWNPWSPWSCLDSKVKTEISHSVKKPNHSLSWDGEYIGSGQMILSKIETSKIEIDLHFFKPFKSSCKIWFELKKLTNESTEVIWGMNNGVPFFLFFLKQMMVSFLSADYNRGLLRLKELAENGEVLSKISEVEKTKQVPLFYLGVEAKTNLSQMKIEMENTFSKMVKDIESREIAIPDGFISVYHHIDPTKDSAHFTTGIFYYQKPSEIKNYKLQKLEEHEALKIINQGPYIHLSDAWNKLFAYQRSKKIRPLKKTPMYEFYLNSPQMVARKDILTEIRFPIA